MTFFLEYASPMGPIFLEAEEKGLTRLWFAGQSHASAPPEDRPSPGHPVLREAVRWLELYFSGQQPDFLPPLLLRGTAFQLKIWQQLLTVPYGSTAAYSELLSSRASAQAVGGAVGRNPIALIIPCHRIIGKDGSLTGYAGGLNRKIALLELEGLHVDRSRKKIKNSTG